MRICDKQETKETKYLYTGSKLIRGSFEESDLEYRKIFEAHLREYR